MNKKLTRTSELQQELQEPIPQIKAISLHQPWASLIAMGLKKFETRSWLTNYRGKLVICAAKKNSKQQESNYDSYASSVGIDLTIHPWSSLPLGMAIAVCDLTDCIEMTSEFIDEQSEAELLCGHWEPDRFAWKLENVQPFSEPIPIKGKQGLWNIDANDVEQWLQASIDGDAIVPQIVETLELTDEEEKERLRLERLVESAFYTAGLALLDLRDKKLYRSTHKTFEAYCRDRFGYNRSRSYQLIDAAIIVETLKKCPQFVDILPTTESQARPLVKLKSKKPEKVVEAWTEAVSQAGGKVPPARIVKEVVQNMQQPKKVPNPWRVGEVAQIIIKGNPDLKGKGGCWAVITTINDFSCQVRLWNGEYQVKPENLKELPYSHQQQQEIKKLSDRLSKIKLDEVEKPMRDFLAGLGKIDRPYLTKLEEKVLGLLEVIEN